MTGAQHYREAERLIAPGEYDEQEPNLVMRDIALAQVHATLAVAAAVAESGGLANVGTLGVLSPWGRALDDS